MAIKKRWTLITILLLILVNISLHLYLASHTRFISDDYCSAAYGKRLGVMRGTWYWYLNWSGRYSASALDSIFGMLGPKTTPIALPIIMLVWLTGLTITIYFILKLLQSNKNLYPLVLGANVIFITFLLAPNVRQSVYWGQGMRSVLPPMILFTIYVGWFYWFRSWFRNRRGLGYWLIASFLFSVGMGGFSETFTSLQLVVFSFTLFIALVNDRFNWKSAIIKILTTAVVGTTFAFTVIIIAPGNSFRQAQGSPPPNFVELIIISLNAYIVFLQGMLDSMPEILGLLGGIGIGLFVGFQYRTIILSKKIWFLLPLLTLALMLVCFPPAAFGLSDTPPGRTLIIPVYIFSVGLTVWSFLIGNQLKARESGRSMVKLIFVITFLLFVASNLIVDIRMFQSREVFIEFAHRWDKTHIQILGDKETNKEQSVVQTMDDVNWAGATTIHARPKFWLNQCVSLYYGIETIAVDDPSSYK